jgi:hypothetical protein
MEQRMDDSYSKVPQGTEWCPECNGYGSSLMEETARCTRCGGTGLVLVADPGGEKPNGHDPARLAGQD